jgi:predicted nucleic acid-binding protein
MARRRPAQHECAHKYCEYTHELSNWLSGLASPNVGRPFRAGGLAGLRADAVLAALVLVRADEPVLAQAASFKDPQLRALDAIHLATALTLGDDPDVFITYDARLARAAARLRLRVVQPGAERLS